MESKATIKPDTSIFSSGILKLPNKYSVLRTDFLKSNCLSKTSLMSILPENHFESNTNVPIQNLNPVISVLLCLRQKIIYWWFYIFFAVNSL
jgi:hypothetical protein